MQQLYFYMRVFVGMFFEMQKLCQKAR